MVRHRPAGNPKQAEQIPQKAGKRSFAVASVISAAIGLFIFPIFFAPMAIVCGVSGFAQASPRTSDEVTQAKDRKGRKWNLIGTVLGIIEIGFLFVVLKT